MTRGLPDSLWKSHLSTFASAVLPLQHVFLAVISDIGFQMCPCLNV